MLLNTTNTVFLFISVAELHGRHTQTKSPDFVINEVL